MEYYENDGSSCSDYCLTGDCRGICTEGVCTQNYGGGCYNRCGTLSIDGGCGG